MSIESEVNSAARLLNMKSEYITLVLATRKWLSVSFRIDLNLFKLVFKALNDLGTGLHLRVSVLLQSFTDQAFFNYSKMMNT